VLAGNLQVGTAIERLLEWPLVSEG
jgi:hypothetical protein